MWAMSHELDERPSEELSRLAADLYAAASEVEPWPGGAYSPEESVLKAVTDRPRPR